MYSIHKYLKVAILAIGLLVLFNCEEAMDTDKQENIDTTAPTASIVSPETGTTIEGEVIVLVNALDNESVAMVEFWVDSVLINTDQDAPWEFTWGTEDYTSGMQYQLVVKVYDPTGNFGISEVVTVLVVAQRVYNSVTDIDGNEYQTVMIGNQEWMAENLKVSHYRNGDPILTGFGDSLWHTLYSGAYAVYDNDPENVPIYGNLYNGYAVFDARNIAPEGWHVATDEDWKVLEMSVGMSRTEADAVSSRGTDEGVKLKYYDGWEDDGNGTNESGFAALPGGYRGWNYLDNVGYYTGKGYYSYFWSATPHQEYDYYVYHRFLQPYDSIWRNFGLKKSGYSVRCIKD